MNDINLPDTAEIGRAARNQRERPARLKAPTLQKRRQEAGPP